MEQAIHISVNKSKSFFSDKLIATDIQCNGHIYVNIIASSYICRAKRNSYRATTVA